MNGARLTKRGWFVVNVAFCSGLVLLMGFVGWLENVGM